MSDYTATCRTNYFRVMDEELYQSLIACVNGIGFQDISRNGVHGFGSYGELSVRIPPSKLLTRKNLRKAIADDAVYADDGTHVDLKDIDDTDSYPVLQDKNGNKLYDFDWDGVTIEDFVEELRMNLPAGECFVYLEAGHEKLKYIMGKALVATKDKVEYFSLNDIIDRKITELLGPDAHTVYEY